jgi:hypothetical protein
MKYAVTSGKAQPELRRGSNPQGRKRLFPDDCFWVSAGGEGWGYFEECRFESCRSIAA